MIVKTFTINQMPEFIGCYRIRPEQPVKCVCVLDFMQKIQNLVVDHQAEKSHYNEGSKYAEICFPQ